VVAAEGVDLMLPAIEWCATGATPEVRAAAAAELRALVASAPHVGCALEFEDLFAAATFRGEAASVPLVPTSTLEVEQVAHRGAMLEAWEHVVVAPDRWRAFTHPRAAAEVAREDAARTATGNALLAIAIGARDRLVARDADTQSRLRALAAELE